MKKCVYILVLLTACLPDGRFETPKVACEETAMETTHTFAEIIEMAGFGIHTFTEDTILEGYVASSDKEGNIYKNLYLQNHPTHPTVGLKFSIDKANLFAIFPIGRKVYVNLKGLSIGYSYGTLTIGKANGASVDRIASTEVFQYFFRSCETVEVVPKSITVNDFSDEYTNILVVLNDVQFLEKDIGQYIGAASTQTMERTLVQLDENCRIVNDFRVTISGYADFKNYVIPTNKGRLTGILTKYYSAYQLLIRTEEDIDFNAQSCAVVKNIQPTMTMQDLVKLYQGNIVEFGVGNEQVVEGYVISTDQFGNFKNTLVVQDAPENPRIGVQLKIDSDAIYENYAVGERILLKLNKLYLDKIKGVFTLGVYKGESIGEIPEEAVNAYVIGTDELHELSPQKVPFEALEKESFNNTLLELTNAQLLPHQLGKAFAYFSGNESAIRYLENCDTFHSVGVVTEGTASFANTLFPVGKGSITGVAYGDDVHWNLKLRNQDDVSFNNVYEACEASVNKVLITEIADPSNATNGRFVELYNAGEATIILNGWKLNKYINGNTTVSNTPIDLSGVILPSKGFCVIGLTDFGTIYGVAPSLVSSYVTGNGDDVYELTNALGEVVDAYGIKGEDGTGKNWEYLDGRAIRKTTVGSPNNAFEITEWEVYSKSNSNAQNAPADFTPFVR